MGSGALFSGCTRAPQGSHAHREHCATEQLAEPDLMLCRQRPSGDLCTPGFSSGWGLRGCEGTCPYLPPQTHRCCQTSWTLCPNSLWPGLGLWVLMSDFRTRDSFSFTVLPLRREGCSVWSLSGAPTEEEGCSTGSLSGTPTEEEGVLN